MGLYEIRPQDQRTIKIHIGRPAPAPTNMQEEKEVFGNWSSSGCAGFLVGFLRWSENIFDAALLLGLRRLQTVLTDGLRDSQ